MALDISNSLDADGDIIFEDTDRYRAYNLLLRDFPDNEYIGINTENMIRDGVVASLITSMLIKYLTDFSVHFKDFAFTVDNKGNIEFDLNFKGDIIRNLIYNTKIIKDEDV